MITGMTIGRFDLILPGHISFLEECRRRCDRLVVGVLSGDDEIFTAPMRVEILRGLKAVDHAIVINETHPGMLRNLYNHYKFTWFFEAESKKPHPDAELLERETPARVVYMPRYSSHTRRQVLRRCVQVWHLTKLQPADLAGIIADKAAELTPYFGGGVCGGGGSAEEVRAMAETQLEGARVPIDHTHPAVTELEAAGVSVTLHKPGHGPECPCDACLEVHRPEFFAKRVPIDQVRAAGGTGAAKVLNPGSKVFDFDAPQVWVGFRGGVWARTSARKFDPVEDQAIADEMRAGGLDVRLMDRDEAHRISGGEEVTAPYMCDCGWSGTELVVEGCPKCKRDDQLTYVAQL